MHRGFTIAELMVVLVIIAILMSLALPSYRGFMVAARRGEAKNNLEHLSSLQSVFKVASTSFSYAVIADTHAVGYHGECSGTGSGWNNDLGFRPRNCADLRYQYWTTGGSSFDVVAWGASDTNRWIYPDCTGVGAAKNCAGKQYSMGDGLQLGVSGGIINCRNIIVFCQ